MDMYQRAFQISIEIHKISLNFPKIEQYALADQIRRASKSVCANIAEGFAKQQNSKAEFKRFLLIALGSAQETRVWVDYCCELEYLDADTAKRWVDEYDAVTRMIQGFINKM